MGKDDLIKPEDAISAALLGGSLTPGGVALPGAAIVTPAAPKIVVPQASAPDPAMMATLLALQGLAFVPPRVQSQAQWGSPVEGPPEPDENQDPFRPDYQAAMGRTETISTDGSQSQEMARVVQGTSEGFTLSIDVAQPPGTTPNGLAQNANVALVVWAILTFGSGNGTATRRIRIDDRLDASLIANFISVKIYLGNLSGKQITSIAANGSPTNSAQVVVQLARGIRGTPNVATFWQVASGAGGQINGPTGVPGPLRINSMSAHLQATSGAQVFLQLFDLPPNGGGPGAGAVPISEWPLGTTPAPGLPYTLMLNQRGISQSLWWSSSTTSGILTVGPNLWTEFEILLF